MGLEVAVSVNGEQISRVLVENRTKRPVGVNTYRWWTFTAGGQTSQHGTVEHATHDGAMVLVAKVAQAAAGPRYLCQVCLQDVERSTTDTVRAHVDTIGSDCLGSHLPWKCAMRQAVSL